MLLQTAVQDAPNGLKKSSVYDVYEEEQHESEQPPKCYSEPSESPLPQVVSELAFPDHANVFVSL
jgi:hypothetical protein